MEQSEPGGFAGAVPIIPIPFDRHEEIDEDTLRRLVEFAVAEGIGAICLPAYASEFYKLSEPERVQVVQIAVNQAAGRTLVVAQSNHGSSRVALAMAQAHIANGADLIAIALPRQFALAEDDLLRYVTPILNGVNVPCLVQDFNPGGPTVGVDFVIRLRAECPNFRYLKLEEPLLAAKVGAIRKATKNQIGILEGWGGLYMMELIPAGICGVMSGLAIADILNLVFDLRRRNKIDEAVRLYEKVLPQIVFALQNMELFLFCEKRLLQARGLHWNACCRNASLTPDPYTVDYVDELNNRILQEIEKSGLGCRSPRFNEVEGHCLFSMEVVCQERISCEKFQCQQPPNSSRLGIKPCVAPKLILFEKSTCCEALPPDHTSS